MTEIIIRRAIPNDIPTINRLLRQVLEVHAEGRPDVFKSGGKKYDDDEIMSIISSEDTPVYVAIGENADVLGYAFCVLKHTKETSILRERREIYIDDLCVDQSSRGLGVGKALFEHVKKVAVEGGFDAVTLNVWNFNEPAVKFYEKCGMTPLKTMMELPL